MLALDCQMKFLHEIWDFKKFLWLCLCGFTPSVFCCMIYVWIWTPSPKLKIVKLLFSFLALLADHGILLGLVDRFLPGLPGDYSSGRLIRFLVWAPWGQSLCVSLPFSLIQVILPKQERKIIREGAYTPLGLDNHVCEDPIFPFQDFCENQKTQTGVLE